ncbi:MAG TPA: hypothetical protein VIQ29_04420 [Ancylobacter sp.]
MARARSDAPSFPPPLIAMAEHRRINELMRERAVLLGRLVKIAPRSIRRIELEREIAALTRQILTAEIALQPVKRPS